MLFFLSVRHLTSRRKQTIFTLLGILVGTAAYCAISGMMLGFQTFIIDQLVNNDAHVRITAGEKFTNEKELQQIFFGEKAAVNWLVPPSGRRDNAFIENAQSWFRRLSSDPEVSAFSPQLQVQVIATRNRISSSSRLIGSDPEKQLQVTNIEKYMLKGHFTDIGNSGNRVVAGEGLMKKLGARVGESISLSGGKGYSSPFKIVGIFRLGIKTLDDTTLFGSLADAQKLNKTPSQISDIAVRLIEVEKAAETALTWRLISDEKVQSWDQANEGIMSVFKTQDIVRYAMIVSILVVAGFGIYNILSMAVNNKKREIAILRSVGFLPKDITWLFLYQGMMLGVIGGLLGVILGYGICKFMATIEVSPDRGLGGNTMLIVFFPSIYWKAFFLAFFSSVVASFVPARSAGKMSPIEIIRTESS